jgi:hypothetical protein
MERRRGKTRKISKNGKSAVKKKMKKNVGGTERGVSSKAIFQEDLLIAKSCA